MTVETRYARTTDGTHVAFQVVGDGPIDMVVQRGWFTNLEHEWAEPILAGIFRRLGSIGRVIRMDRRGSGLSDRFDQGVLPNIEDRIDDIRAVMAAAGSERIALIGLGNGSALFSVFAATHPDRSRALVMFSPPPSMVRRADEATIATAIDDVRRRWASRELAEEYVQFGAPSRADDEQLVAWVQEDQRLSGSVDDAVALYRLALETNVDDVLPAINVPTLVAWRAEDDSAIANHIVGRIPVATACRLPGEDAFLLSGDAPGHHRDRGVHRAAGAARARARPRAGDDPVHRHRGLDRDRRRARRPRLGRAARAPSRRRATRARPLPRAGGGHRR